MGPADPVWQCPHMFRVRSEIHRQVHGPGLLPILGIGPPGRDLRQDLWTFLPRGREFLFQRWPRGRFWLSFGLWGKATEITHNLNPWKGCDGKFNADNEYRRVATESPTGPRYGPILFLLELEITTLTRASYSLNKPVACWVIGNKFFKKLRRRRKGDSMKVKRVEIFSAIPRTVGWGGGSPYRLQKDINDFLSREGVSVLSVQTVQVAGEYVATIFYEVDEEVLERWELESRSALNRLMS